MERDPIEFYNSDGKPARTAKLNQLAGCVASNARRIKACETGTTAPAPAPAPDSGGTWDPGDLTVYYENGKA